MPARNHHQTCDDFSLTIMLRVKGTKCRDLRVRFVAIAAALIAAAAKIALLIIEHTY